MRAPQTQGDVGHRKGVGQGKGAYNRAMTAQDFLADRHERLHAQRPHVAERHWLNKRPVPVPCTALRHRVREPDSPGVVIRALISNQTIKVQRRKGNTARSGIFVHGRASPRSNWGLFWGLQNIQSCKFLK